MSLVVTPTNAITLKKVPSYSRHCGKRVGGGHLVAWTFCLHLGTLTLSIPETKVAEFANSIDFDEMAHNEPPHLDLHC